MPRTARLWLFCNTVAAGLLAVVASWRDETIAWNAIPTGIVVSVVTMVACFVTLSATSWRDKPLHRMLLETSIRLTIPLSFLLAMVIARRDLLSVAYMLYFLPFQLVTVFVGTVGAVRTIEPKQNDSLDNEF